MVEPRSGNGGDRAQGTDPSRLSLRGKTLYIPRMSDEGARLIAGAFRSIGVDARVNPPSDARTKELGSRYLSGEECYPALITLGNFLKIMEMDDFDPDRVYFFMPGAEGPCRFGQYAHLFRKVFRERGFPEATVVSPSSRYGYQEFSDLDMRFERRAWRALVAADILRKLRLMVRPYEVEPGATDAIIETALAECADILGREGDGLGRNLKDLVAALTKTRDRLRALPRRDEERPLIGVVGEIFCRLNDYSNGHVLRRIENLGGEAWLADITEWIHYTRYFRDDFARQTGRQGAGDILKMKLRDHIQSKDERALLEPFAEDFAGREEPHDFKSFLELSEPYLPFRGSLGEMTLSVAKAVYLQRMGVDGIIDISPFTCMNGIICESVYPRVSRENGEIPIRNVYFDGTESDLDRDLGMFLDLARGYRRRRHRAAHA